MGNETAASITVDRPARTEALTRGVARLFVDMGLTPLAEFRLATGRRADIAAIDGKGRIAIAEIKSCRADFEGDGKWRAYLEYCDRFYFAVDPAFPKDILPVAEGLIVADGFGAMIVRAPAERALAPARRKAVTLRFARQAARKALTLGAG